MKSISLSFLVGESTAVSKVIRRTCQVLREQLQGVFRPVTEELWRDVADVFELL